MVERTLQQKSSMMIESSTISQQQKIALQTPLIATKQVGLVIALVLITSGCAHIKSRPLVDTQTTAIPSAPTAPTPNGSIFQSAQPAYYGYQPLFEDRRPRNVGDILTINLQENVSASKNSSANANRTGKTGFLAAILPGFMQGWIGGKNTELDIKGNSDFSGKGGANANNTFKGTITVTVDQLLANGNLHVVGEKRIAINQGTESIRFSGVVNPRTIGSDNHVSSTQVADARIEYVGDGYINESQNMGWLQRFFLNVSPY
ncbi:flagellar basal body L-ring protein FlgH [Providencia rettgeri]|nr:flagellar basal body L-ring protein FlgH [Providencia rettgeri]